MTSHTLLHILMSSSIIYILLILLAPFKHFLFFLNFLPYPLAAAAAAKLLQLCPTLCDPIDGSPSGSPVPGILQARTLEWVAISFSSGLHETEK